MVGEAWKRLAHWKIGGGGLRTAAPSQCHPGLAAQRKGRAASAGDSVTSCGEGKEPGRRGHALDFTAYSLPSLSFHRRQGRDRGDSERKQSQSRATPSVLSTPGWSGQVGAQLPSRAVEAAGSEGLATLSLNFKGGLLVAAACSRTSLSGHWRP